MKREKGQAMVEFALVLMLFILVVIGIMYFALFFSDYLALNSLARSVARDAALVSDSTHVYQSVRDKYISDTKEAGGNLLPNQLYVWNPSGEDGMKFVSLGSGSIIRVELTAKLNSDNEDSSGLAGAFSRVTGAFMENMTVDYEIYSENPTTSSSSTSSTSTSTSTSSSSSSGG